MRDHIKSLTLNVDSANMVHNVAEKSIYNPTIISKTSRVEDMIEINSQQ